MHGVPIGHLVFCETGSFIVGIIGAIITGMILGLLMERFIIQPVYGNHIQQILITLGVMFVLSEMLKVVWGLTSLARYRLSILSGSWEVGRYRHYQISRVYYRCGPSRIARRMFLMNRTKIGLSFARV